MMSKLLSIGAAFLAISALVSCGGASNWSNTPTESVAPESIGQTYSAASVRYSRYEGGAVAEMWEVERRDDREIRQGLYLRWRPNGSLELYAEYVDGKVHGKQQKYFPSGELQEDVAYTDGKPNGAVTRWWENGVVQTRGAYKDGEPVGDWEHWSADGEKELPKK